MTTPVYNVTGNEAGTVTIQVQVQESDGTAADLTGYTGACQVRPEMTSEELLATGEVDVDAGGTVTAVIPDDQTVDWNAGFYDIRITSPDGVVEYVCRGQITLTPSVTLP